MADDKRKRKPLLSDRFGMVVDEQRAMLFHLIVQTAFLTNPVFTDGIQKYQLERCLEEFMKELSDKEHGMGWCKDPDCELKNGPNEE